MATNDSQNTFSLDDVPWPIAPDGYIPNSVIRCWMKLLKRAKWGHGRDNDEDEEDEQFFVGQFPENYKSLRARLRENAKEQKRTYMQWDYRPDLDEPTWIKPEYGSGSQADTEEEEEIRSTYEEEEDEDIDSSNLLGMKDTKRGGKRLEFDSDKDKKVSYTDRSCEQSKDKITGKFIKGEASDHEEDQEALTEEGTEETGDGSMKSQDNETTAPDSFNQAEQGQPPTDDDDGIGTETLPGDATNVQIETTVVLKDHTQETPSQKFSAKTQKTIAGSAKGRSEKTERQKSEVFRKDLMDAKDPTAKTKLCEAKEQKVTTEKTDVSEILDKPIKPPVKPFMPHTDSSPQRPAASAETPSTLKKLITDFQAHREDKKKSSDPLPRKHSKPPKPIKEPASVLKPEESTSCREPNLVQVDKKVMGLFKQFKNGKWLLPKAPGKWSSTDLHPSKSKGSDSGSDLEHQEPVKSPHQRGSGKEAEGGLSRPLDQNEVWKFIMEDLSVDQLTLWELLQDAPADLQPSLDKGRHAGMTHQASKTRLGSEKPTFDKLQSSKASRARGKLGKAKEPVNYAAIFRLLKEKQTGIEGVETGEHTRFPDDGIQVRPTSAQSMVFNDSVQMEAPNRERSTWTRIDGIDMGPTRFTDDRFQVRPTSTQSMDLNDSAQMEAPNRESSPWSRIDGINMGGPTRFTDDRFQVRPTSTQSMDLNDSAQMEAPNRESSTWSRIYGIDMGGPTRFTDDRFQVRPTSAQTLDDFAQMEAPVFIDGTGKVRDSTLQHLAQTIDKTVQRWSFEDRSIESISGPGAVSIDESMVPQGEFEHLRTAGQGVISNTEYKKFILQRVKEGFDNSMGQDNSGFVSRDTAVAAPGMEHQTPKSSQFHGVQYIDQDESERLVRPVKSLGQTGETEGSSEDQSGSFRVSMHGSMSAAETVPEDKSQALLGLQKVRSMVHTPGLLISPEPEQFLKVMFQNCPKDITKNKPMPKWRKELYKLLFLYGFRSSQTAKMFANEKDKQTQTKKQHRGDIYLYPFMDSITSSALHDRVVRRVRFQDVDQATTDFHCVIPLPSINNLISLEKYGETDYGKLLFEWERGEEDEDQIKVASVSTA